MTTEYQVGYAEGYEAGAQDIHKRDARIAQLEAALLAARSRVPHVVLPSEMIVCFPAERFDKP